MPKIKIYKCNDWNHVRNTQPNKNSDVAWHALKKEYEERLKLCTDEYRATYLQKELKRMGYGPAVIEYWQEYWDEKISDKGNITYRCKMCIDENERKKKIDEKDLPDEYVISKLKMSHVEKKQITPLLIELKRATLRLNYLIKTPVVKCKHGNFFVHTKDAVIKAGRDAYGNRRFKCRLCMKDAHRKHYLANKEELKIKHHAYKMKDPEKHRKMKNESSKKSRALNPEKHRNRRNLYDKLNPARKSERQKRYKDAAVSELKDRYVKQKLVLGTELKYADIPQDMVDAHREVMRIKRIIKKAEEPLRNLKKRIK